MGNSDAQETPGTATRREFLKRSALAVAAPGVAARELTASQAAAGDPQARTKKPNVLLYIADQFRWDFVHAYGLNPTPVTPNLDSVARRGIAFRNAVTNQPLCSPSRACLFTGMYASETGVWTLGPGLKPGAVTLATLFGGQGYSTNYIGKWHLAPNVRGKPESHGFVPPQYRGGFKDLWEASNELELTSHPYEGTIWNGDGTPMHFKDIYRVDYITSLAVDFLRRRHEQPFFLVVSQLEPHFQNDAVAFIPPKEYAKTYQNAFVPHDLRFFPGDWEAQLAGYYGDIKRIDDSVGTVLQTLQEQGIEDNTIFVFISDHGCHFRTRNAEYKRSPHESSIHIPLVMQGPGLNHSRMVEELVSMVDVTPTLLDAAGMPPQAGMRGRSALPLATSAAARSAWAEQSADGTFIQLSQSEVGRALRTPEWTYCAVDLFGKGNTQPASSRYQEYQLYNLASDPHQLLNLAGRRETKKIAAELRARLIADIKEVEKMDVEIVPAPLYP
ncbi:MAG: sulfatase-like hydrolase/transferase [Terriglobia bacterium]